MKEHNNWNELGHHVIKELERLNNCYEKLDSKIDKLSIGLTTQVAILKVKAGIWGLMGACIPTIGAILFVILK